MNKQGMNGSKKVVKKRDFIAKDLLTNGLYRCKIVPSAKTTYSRKQKHKSQDMYGN